MPGKTIFHDFQPHESVEIVDMDHVGRRMRFRTPGVSTTTLLPFRDIDVMSSSLHEGRIVDVQFGRITRNEATYPKSTIRAGEMKISAMRHPTPTITPLALAVMRWSLGEHGCMRELASYAQRANTIQRKAEYHHDGGRRLVELDLSGGCIKACADLGGARITLQGVHLPEDIPDVIVNSLQGRRIDELIDHPALRDAGKIQKATLQTGGGVYLHLDARTLQVRDVIAQPEIAIAA